MLRQAAALAIAAATFAEPLCAAPPVPPGRGTSHYLDVLTDLSVNPVQVELGERRGYMHEGVLRAAAQILPQVQVGLSRGAARDDGEEGRA